MPRDVIYVGRKIQVVVDTATGRDGLTVCREMVLHPGAVAVLPLLDAEHIVCVRNVRPTVGETLLEIPAGTQHGEVFKLKGKGVPDLRSYKNGDEIVQILIEIPKKLSDRQKQLLKEFAASEDEKLLPQRKSFVDKLKKVFATDQ